MTISPVTHETRDDAELARAAARGESAAFGAIYNRYADRLHDFCIGMLRDRDAAADCVQDVFVTAATRLAQLREPERLRSWLYAIARNEALARIQARRRERLSEELPDMPCNGPDLDALAARSELAELIDDACGGLSDRDRTVFELAYRHGLDGPELADALGVSHTNANTLIVRLRNTIDRSLGALLVSRRAKAVADGCPDLVAMLDDWDGRFTVVMRKRVARHIDNCPACEAERRRMVNPVALLGSAPILIPAPAWLRAKTLTQLPSALTHTAGAHTAGAHQSWWPPHNFNPSDLGAPHTAAPQAPPQGAGFTKPVGPAQRSRPADPTAPLRQMEPNKVIGPTKQVGPAPELAGGAPTAHAMKFSPKFPADPDVAGAAPTPLNTDSRHGQLGGRARTALLVALVLAALGTVAVLGSVLLRQNRLPTSPAVTPLAPAATTVPVTTTPAAPPTTSAIVSPTPTPTQSPPSTSAPDTNTDPGTPVPSTSLPASVATQIPTSGAGAPGSSGGAGGSPGAGTSGGPSNPDPVTSGGSQGRGGAAGGSPGAGNSTGGSGPVIGQKVFPGNGSNLNNCPVIAHCSTAPNGGTNGLH